MSAPRPDQDTAIPEVIVRGGATEWAQSVEAGSHRLTSDEPVSRGGKDTGPTPYDLLAAALGSCTSMTIGYYARREGYPLERVVVGVRHSKVHAEDCESCDASDRRVDRLDVRIALTGPLTDAQRQDLLRIAGRCPVHRTLTSTIEIRTSLEGPQS